MDNGRFTCPIHDLPPPWAVDQGPEVLYGESTMLLLGAPLGGARDQVRRFLWLIDREWTEALLLPLKAGCRFEARKSWFQLARQLLAVAGLGTRYGDGKMNGHRCGQ